MAGLKYHKKSLIIISIFLILLFAIASVSASENASDNISLENSGVSEMDAEDNLMSDACLGSDDSSVEDNSSNQENVSGSSNSTDPQDKPLLTYADAYEKTTVEYSSVTSEYTSGNIVYKVKVYATYDFNGTKYKEPKYGSIIKLRVYTGSTLKSYTASIDNEGVASIKVPDLSVGYHEVEIYVDDIKRAISYIKVVKSTTKVYAPAKTVKKGTYYKIKVVDSHGNCVKNVALKVKVYTNGKSKTHAVYTNSKGAAKLDTGKLALGTHSIIITTSSQKYKISASSKIVIKSTIPKTAAALKALTPAKTVKKGTGYAITVKDSYNDAVKNVALKVSVYTGKKVTTYKIKTNSNGVATLKTDKLSLGTHKIVISSNDKNYKISKTSNVIVKKTLVSNAVQTTVLKNITYYPTADGKCNAKLGWLSKAGSSYQILRKTNDSYALLSVVKANSTTSAFYDEVDNGTLYTYAVREIIAKNGENILAPFDREGLKLLECPNVKVDFQNMKAEISWDKVENATKYIIFRKVGRDASFKSIASVDSSELSFTDFYYKSASELTGVLNSNTFCDPSFNNLFYTVRACAVQTAFGVRKTSYGLYLKDGDFHLEAPSIVSLNNNKIRWGYVPNAEGYLVLKRNSSDEEWEIIGQAGQRNAATISMKLGTIDNDSYYSVKAFATKNGKLVFSGYDTGFSLMNFSQDNSQYRILYFGDSITYGSPYKTNSTRHIFSIPYRVAQLLGCVYFNPSIPGSTYHDLGQDENGINIENTHYYRYRICREVVDPISIGELPGNWKDLDSAKNSEGITNTSLDEYNIVVLAAGTNDYLDNTVLGDEDSNDTYTFNGAFNHIMSKIENASQMRVARNETPIKVVFVDLYYSDRTYDIKVRNNRDVTPNQINLTLTDYQNELHKQYAKWENSPYLTLYNFKTRDYGIANEENCPYTASDNLHFTKFTYGQYGNAFAGFLLENVF